MVDKFVLFLTPQENPQSDSEKFPSLKELEAAATVKRLYFENSALYEKPIKHLIRGLREEMDPDYSANLIKNAFAKGVGYDNYAALVRNHQAQTSPRACDLTEDQVESFEKRIVQSIMECSNPEWMELTKAAQRLTLWQILDRITL